MKKLLFLTVFVTLFAFTSIQAQILNQPANWPNVSWTVSGTYDAGSLIDPTANATFSYDDDNAGNGSLDDVQAESPIIDLTAANTGGESFISISSLYSYYNLGDELNLEYYDADALSWITWASFTSNGGWDDYLSCGLGVFLSSNLDISAFSPSQLAGFKYRFSYDDLGGWQYGFCMQSPIIVSTGCPGPSAQNVINITATTAELHWTTGGAADWHVEWGPTGYIPGTGTIESVTIYDSLVLNTLAGTTTYDWYVFDDCGTDSSILVGPNTFTTLETCPAPTAQNVMNITGSTADLLWTTGGATDWYVEWGPTGFTPGAGIIQLVTLNDSLRLSGLTGTTTYDWYVFDDCGADSSVVVGPNTFTTACPVFTPDYTEDFTSFLDVCWSTDNNSGFAFWKTGNLGGNSAKINLYTTNNDDWLTSPSFDLSAGGYELSINVGVTNYNSLTPDVMGTDDSVRVVYSEDAGATWTMISSWTALDALSNAANAFVYPLASTGTNVIFAIVATDGPVDDANDYDFHVVDFTVRTTPTCPEPSAQNVLNITGSTTDLLWTTGGATDWIVEWGPTGFTPGAGTIQLVTLIDSLRLNGLTGNTTYDWYVFDDCGADSSVVVGPNTFTTACSVFTPNFTENFTSFLDVCWSNDNNGGFAVWKSGTLGGNSARINLYSNVNDNWLTSPSFDLSAGGYELLLNVGVTGWNNLTPATMGSDDSVRVVYSEDAGATWTIISSWTALDALSNAANPFVYPLVSTGADVIFAIIATDGPVDDANDYDFHVVDFTVRSTPSCNISTNLNVANITESSADLLWTTSGAADWIVEWGPTGFTQGTGTMVLVTSNDSLEITGLTGATYYDWYVMDSCGVANNSVWTTVNTFTTSCPASFVAPYYENFDASLSLPNCWTDTAAALWRYYSSTGTNSPKPAYGVVNSIDHTTGTGNFTWIDGSNGFSSPNELISPVIDFSGLTNPYVGAWILSNNTSDLTQNVLNIEAWDGSEWIVLGQYAANDASWIEVGFVIPSTITSPAAFRLVQSRGPNDGATYNNDLLIDDFFVMEAPSCPAPSLQMVSNITGYTALLDWTTGLSTNWVVEYGPTGFVLGTGSILQVSTNDSVTITGLTPLTEYDWYVFDDCGADSSSVVALFNSFTTNSSCPAPSATMTDNITTSSADLIWTAFGVSSWYVEYGPVGFALGSGTSVLVANDTFNLSSLPSNSSFEWYVYSDCAPIDSSSVVGPMAFTTNCMAANSVEFELITGNYAGEVTWEIHDSTQAPFPLVVASGSGYSNYTTYNETICLTPGGVYTFVAMDNFGDGWNGGTFELGLCNGSTIFANNDGNVVDNGINGPNGVLQIEASEVFTFVAPVTDDVTPTEVIAPMTSCGLGMENVSVSISNVGVNSTNSTSDMDVMFFLDGALIVTDVNANSLAQCESDTIVSSVALDFSTIGIYEVMVVLVNVGDMNSSNDTIITTVEHIPTINSLPYIESFEGTTGGWTSGTISNPTNSWQHGTPAASNINTAAEGAEAWVTTLDGNIATNEDSYLISPCIDFTGITEPTLNFSSIFPSTTSISAELESSIDGGTTWAPLQSFGLQTVWTDNSIDLANFANESDVRFRILISTTWSAAVEGFGFDNVVICQPIVNPTAIPMNLCTGDTFDLDSGGEVTTGGLHNDTIAATTGCDSIITYNFSMIAPSAYTDVHTACDTYDWIDGMTYTASNNSAIFTLTNTVGCDSVITLDLTINNSDSVTTTITACDTYDWIDGMTYTSSNNSAMVTLTNMAGCDSVVTLDLTINYSNSGTTTVIACDTYTWIDGMTYTASNNSAMFTVTNMAGCDSVVTLDLTINNNAATDIIVACGSHLWLDGITYTADNNIATFTTTNVAGCDSVITLDLTIAPTSIGSAIVTACNSYYWHGTTYTSSNNTATFTETNVAGCDSVVTLNLTINYSSTYTDAITSCDSYEWIDGNTYSESNNIATFTVTNTAGCDSVITLDLTINNSTSTGEQLVLCGDQQSFTLADGVVVTEAGTYTANTTNEFGCGHVTTYTITSCGVSIFEIDNSIGINLFPNPTTDVLNVVFSEKLSSENNIEIVNLLGQNVYSNSNVDVLTLSINTSNLTSGVYYLNVTSDNKTSVKSFTVSK